MGIFLLMMESFKTAFQLVFNKNTLARKTDTLHLKQRVSLNLKYAIDNLLRAEIASKSATSLLISISP
jgi:hypothetical protein